MRDTIYWIWLSERLGAGSKELLYLLENYSSPYEIYRADEDEIGRLNIKDRTKLALSDKNMNAAYEINDYCSLHGIGIVTYGSTGYPEKLKKISDPPTLLYFRGELPDTNDFLSVSIVGTRKMSEYGKRMAYKIAYELAASGAVVVSGMALGVDSVAACGAICGGGKTIAVLGSGIDVIYPSQHKKLYEIIAQNGAVISEYPPMSEPEASHFPVRNRIISGLSNGTLIVECSERSGALITADRASEQGRDVFALPGNMDKASSSGTNKLIRDGASIITETEDILENYEFYYGNKINRLALGYSKGNSALNEDNLKEMGVYLRDENERAKPETPRKNILRPRFTPKNKNESKLPSTLKKPTAPEPQKSKLGAEAEKELEELDENERNVLEAMPDDRAVAIDEIMHHGFECSGVMGTLAMLEIKGLVTSLPGGLYIKT